jgi:ubiquitin-conjugating enzyme E2 variant
MLGERQRSVVPHGPDRVPPSPARGADPAVAAERTEGVTESAADPGPSPSAAEVALGVAPPIPGIDGTTRPSYSPAFRFLEWLGVATSVVMAGLLAWRLYPAAGEHWAGFVTAALLAVLVMDFFSGVLHWAGDTWGSVDWKYIGATVIRTFREHHVDPESITRHDPIEVNATNSIIAIPFLSLGLWAAPESYFGAVFALTFSVSGMATNQIHLWAHRPENPWWIRALQRSRIILSPGAHAHHHLKPYTDHYCITTGWTNHLLCRVRFWRAMEWLITRLTGAVPREEDKRADAVIAADRARAQRAAADLEALRHRA